MSNKIIVPAAVTLKQLLNPEGVELPRIQAAMVAQVEGLAGQEFEPRGLALAMLVCTNKALESLYGKGKSILSLEGCAALALIHSYVFAFVQDKTAAQAVCDSVSEQLAVFALL